MSRTEPVQIKLPRWSIVETESNELMYMVGSFRRPRPLLLENKLILYCKEEEWCSYSTYNRHAMARHRRLTHKNPRPIGRPVSSDAAYRCDVSGCIRAYGSQKALMKHKQIKHPEFVSQQDVTRTVTSRQTEKRNFSCGFYIPSEDKRCGSSYKMRRELMEHLRTAHDMTCREEEKQFTNREEMKAWKKCLENEPGRRSLYVATKGGLKRRNTTVEYLECHRSGAFISESRGQRAPRAKGSNKIGFVCSAYMRIVAHDITGAVNVTYCSEHYGHDFDEERLPNADGTPKIRKRCLRDSNKSRPAKSNRVAPDLQEMEEQYVTAEPFYREPEVCGADFEPGDVATVGGRIYYGHPTEGVCVVQQINMEQPYVARVWLRHAQTTHTGTDPIRQLDFSEFTRLGFTVEYVFDDTSLIDENGYIETNTMESEIAVQQNEYAESSMFDVQVPECSTRTVDITDSDTIEEMKHENKPFETTQSQDYVRDFACSECNFTASSQPALKNHYLNSHARAREKETFECGDCNKRFKLYRTLERHIHNEHRAVPALLCETCGGSFRCKLDLEKHTKLLHPWSDSVQYVQCSYCEAVFRSHTQCQTHVIHQHGHEKDQVLMNYRSPDSHLFRNA